MQTLHLFAGAGGSCWAGKLLGWKTIGYVENDEYCQKVIRQRIRDGYFDDAPIWSDVRDFNGISYRGKVDILTGGFPCQPFSVAGKRSGASDSRNLWPETLQILNEIKPTQAFLENVPGLISSGYFHEILKGLSKSGYDAKWKVVSAAEVGAPHKRDRLWILANSYDDGQLTSKERRCLASRADDNKEGSKSAIESTRCGGKPASVGNELGTEEKRNVSNASSQGLERQQQSFREEQKHSAFSDSRWWEAEPAVGRVANGVAHRKHRLKALGNGWVPQTAAVAWEILNQR